MEFLSRIISIFSPSNESAKDILVEKRVSPRICCSFEGKALHKERKNVEVCTIVEVSSSGLRLCFPIKPKKGETLLIAIKADQGIDCSRYKVDRVSGEVMWARRKPKSPDYFVGLKFSDPEGTIKNSWVSFMLKKFGFDMQKSFQKRKDVRAGSSINLVYTTGSGASQRGVAYNIGMGGLLLSGPQCLPENSQITIIMGPYGQLTQLTLTGKVVRKRFEPKTTTWLSGISFIHLQGDSLRLLGDYVITVLKESAQA
jgi:hypothetical protein